MVSLVLFRPARILVQTSTTHCVYIVQKVDPIVSALFDDEEDDSVLLILTLTHTAHSLRMPVPTACMGF